MSATQYSMSIRRLKREYFRAQKKVWRYQRKIRRHAYGPGYDPYGTYKDLNLTLIHTKQWGQAVADELIRREVHLFKPKG